MATRQDRDADSLSQDKLEVAFARHQDALLGMLVSLVGNLEDARDALQESFVKCWRNQEQIPQVANLRAWIFRITLNTGRDIRSTAWRRRRRTLEHEETMIAQSAAPEVDATRREQLAMVRQAIGDLRIEEQEVFQLRQNGQMTYEEIGKALDIPVGTVKTRMRLALTKLRRAMEGK